MHMDKVVFLVDAPAAAFEQEAMLLTLPAESIGRVRVGSRIVHHVSSVPKSKLRENMILIGIETAAVVAAGVVVPEVEQVVRVGEVRVGRSPLFG